MIQPIIILVTLAALTFAAKVPVDHVSDMPSVPSVDKLMVTTSVPVVTTHKDKVHTVNHGPHVPHKVPHHVQHIAEQAHQHVPQVVNHHLGVKKDTVVSQVPLVADVPQGHDPHVSHEKPLHVQNIAEQVHQHVPQVVNHHLGIKKDVSVPQVPEVSHVSEGHVSHVPPKVPQHVQNIAEQVHQHVPQVVNHHVGVKRETHAPQGPHVPHASHVPHTQHTTLDGHIPHIPQVSHAPNVVSSGVVVAVTPLDVPHASDKITEPKPNKHQVHIDVIHQHADGHKHFAHNVPNVVVDGATPDVNVDHQHQTIPQAVVDKIQKVEQHIQQVMQQAHQHIPQVINHQISQKKQKHEQHDHHPTTVTTTTQVPHSIHSGENVSHVTTHVPAVDTDVHHPAVIGKTTKI